jgi:hypothetical protein
MALPPFFFGGGGIDAHSFHARLETLTDRLRCREGQAGAPAASPTRPPQPASLPDHADGRRTADGQGTLKTEAAPTRVPLPAEPAADPPPAPEATPAATAAAASPVCLSPAAEPRQASMLWANEPTADAGARQTGVASAPKPTPDVSAESLLGAGICRELPVVCYW